MKLIKTTLYSGIITLIRISAGFISSKIIAVFTGPAGVAVIGALINFITIFLTFGNGAINNGVVKYTSEINSRSESLKDLFSTAFKISLVCSILVATVILSFATTFSELIFNSSTYVNVIRVFGLTLVFYSLNSLLISILNGKGQIKDYTIVNIVGSIVGLVFTIVLVYEFKIKGALYALVLVQSVVFFVTFFLIFRSKWFSISLFLGNFNKNLAIKLSHFSLMTIVTALTIPVSQIILRNFLTKHLGVQEAGYWQGMVRISDAYLMIVTTSLGTYFLPKLSSLQTDKELKREILNGYKIILPPVLLGCTAIYFLRFFIIKLIYTPDFIEMENLFVYQLIGDFFKIAAWLLAYLMLAKAMTKSFIITELIFTLVYVLLSYFFVNKDGLVGITVAFAITYVIYFLIMLVLFRKIILS